MAGPSLMDSLFQSSLEDVIKSLRLCPPGSESAFISKSVEDIRREIKSTDPQTKATAVEKLAYLHSLHGVDVSWAAFHYVELSSSAAHSHKRIAYLAAALSFNPTTTDVILLLTNQLRKDLSSPNVHDVGVALSTLSSICNPDLSRDLTPELFTLLGSSRFLIRKKAICVLLRVFKHYPDAVRVCFKRVVENLESADMGVLSAAVGLFSELTVSESTPYLPLAPEFHKILVDCRNNWVLIKILKIFSKLAPVEPRLGRRLVEPICEHLERTGAKSLAFECVRTILTSFSDHVSALKLAVGKVKEFLESDDSNLRYLALQALSVAVSQTHTWAVLENKESVVKALSDGDINIRLEALALVMSMVSEDNLMEICSILIGHARRSDPEFCNEILGLILRTCSRNFYELVFDFDWYVSFLGEMARLQHCQKGKEIEDQLIDIALRVKDVRGELVKVARNLVIDPSLLGNPLLHRVLAACSWISGEYVELSKDPVELTEALVQPMTAFLPPPLRSIYIQAAFKVLTFCLCRFVEPSGNTMMTKESILGLLNLVEANLRPLAAECDEAEVQERASNVVVLIELARPKLGEQQESDVMMKASDFMNAVYDFFSEELGPLPAGAQERVRLPDGLLLGENLDELEEICGGDVNCSLPTSFQPPLQITAEEEEEEEEAVAVSESTSLLAKHRKRHGLYYLPSDDRGAYPPVAIDEEGEEEAEEEDDLRKLSLLTMKRRPDNRVKARPVVVKLDDDQQQQTGSLQKVVSGEADRRKGRRRKQKSRGQAEIPDFLL
ncbi:hypothetical protein M569_12412 [Genlisea aurea]|uniref:Clathrin/coatomer adaptor adaptin-like N-terminal domain-containing protein n=1 Tax=Genlisea aurea TaxID=192259 RepID=S8C6H3_9LAMI|nr:hypothetical protein M569_12412 [Genlisea aurea]